MTDATQTPPRKPAPLPTYMSLAIAGVSGMSGWVFTHPFEKLKNTVMMAPKGTSYATSWSAVKQRGFYDGIASGLMRQVVYAPIRLGCYPIFRDAIVPKGTDPNVLQRTIAGASAGMFASFLSSPVEVCLVLQTTGKEKMSAVTAFQTVYRNSGVAGYWNGIGALASRAALVGICQVAVHDQSLAMVRNYDRMKQKHWSNSTCVNLASIITSVFYSIATMPVEVARVRMSAQAAGSAAGVTPQYRNVLQCIGLIAREEGVLSIFDAFVPYCARCTMHTVTCFYFIAMITQFAQSQRGQYMS